MVCRYFFWREIWGQEEKKRGADVLFVVGVVVFLAVGIGLGELVVFLVDCLWVWWGN